MLPVSERLFRSTGRNMKYRLITYYTKQKTPITKPWKEDLLPCSEKRTINRLLV